MLNSNCIMVRKTINKMKKKAKEKTRFYNISKQSQKFGYFANSKMKIIEVHLFRKQLFSWLCLNYMFVSLNVKTRTRKYVSNLFSNRHMIERPPARMRGKLGSPWSHKSTHFINSTCNFHNESKSTKVNTEEGNVMNILVNKTVKNVSKENTTYKQFIVYI